ncbi:MAG: ribbon-helix-helix protein, CopG family [Bryobacterales bacterium]|nr:ribbon-helix-helix protein, CopG family [Bryobacterales bacterium]
MELTKQTTISFPADLYGRLAQLAEQRHSSVDDLVREACRAPYSRATRAERVAAVKSLATLNLPVGTPEEMKRESVPPVEALP